MSITDLPVTDLENAGRHARLKEIKAERAKLYQKEHQLTKDLEEQIEVLNQEEADLDEAILESKWQSSIGHWFKVFELGRFDQNSVVNLGRLDRIDGHSLYLTVFSMDKGRLGILQKTIQSPSRMLYELKEVPLSVVQDVLRPYLAELKKVFEIDCDHCTKLRDGEDQWE